jgi:hypothetical protein
MSSCTLSISRLWMSAALVLTLSGCATFEDAADRARTFATQHPVVTGVATAVVVGGVVYALDHHGHHSEPPNRTSPCAPLPITECAQ